MTVQPEADPDARRAGRITLLSYGLLAIAGIILLFLFPARGAGNLFTKYLLVYLVVAGVAWWFPGNRHPVAMAWMRLLAAGACLAFSVLMTAWYWAMAL
jgi:hypothetical protein